MLDGRKDYSFGKGNYVTKPLWEKTCRFLHKFLKKGCVIAATNLPAPSAITDNVPGEKTTDEVTCDDGDAAAETNGEEAEDDANDDAEEFKFIKCLLNVFTPPSTPRGV